MRNSIRWIGGALVLCAGYLPCGPALAQSKPSEIKIAIVQFLSGAAAPHDAADESRRLDAGTLAGTIVVVPIISGFSLDSSNSVPAPR